MACSPATLSENFPELRMRNETGIGLVAWAAETATDRNECLTSVATFAFSFPFNLHSPDNLVLIISTSENKYQTMFCSSFRLLLPSLLYGTD